MKDLVLAPIKWLTQYELGHVILQRLREQLLVPVEEILLIYLNILPLLIDIKLLNLPKPHTVSQFLKVPEVTIYKTLRNPCYLVLKHIHVLVKWPQKPNWQSQFLEEPLKEANLLITGILVQAPTT